MANEVYGILYSNVHTVSGETYENGAPDEEYFLRNVITPMYDVLCKVTTLICIHYLFHITIILLLNTFIHSFLSRRKQREIGEVGKVIQVGETMTT